MGGAGENTRPLACQPPACDGKKRRLTPLPRALADCPVGNTGPNRGT